MHNIVQGTDLSVSVRPQAEVEGRVRKRPPVEGMLVRNLSGTRKQPPEMSITEGWNPPNEKEEEKRLAVRSFYFPLLHTRALCLWGVVCFGRSCRAPNLQGEQ